MKKDQLIGAPTYMLNVATPNGKFHITSCTKALLTKTSRSKFVALTCGLGIHPKCELIYETKCGASDWSNSNLICVHTYKHGWFHFGTNIFYLGTKTKMSSSAAAVAVEVASALSILEAINNLRTEEHFIDIQVEVCGSLIYL